MRRPIRTRRLSIAAMVSLLALVVVAGATARSFWTWDTWTYGDRKEIGVEIVRGLICCAYLSAPAGSQIPTGHDSGNIKSIHAELLPSGLLAFTVANQVYHLPSGDLTQHAVWVSLWFQLLLLMIAPLCWLIARPANAPAFPVIRHD